ncbi:hypothetical protein [Halorussus litoreus]|uniref:hypothetical protein n=1 Tax=Halorussus litoreus TaxID=1710536 RepID=UPI000E2828B4|nr:hypothetical protein [Halorussus litoreus]
MFESPSTDDGTERLDSDLGESETSPARTFDERRLYGDPCHEVDAERDEQTLYGDPQHETARAPDVERLSAWERVESLAEPRQSATSETRTAGATER